MIDATLWTANGHTTGFRISGHAGYEDSGKDIVCAAVSSAMQLTANGITEILRQDPVLRVEENAVILQTKKGCGDSAVFAMLDAIGRNRKDEAFRLLHNLLVSGTPEFGLVKMITSQIELILSVKELKEEGNSLAAIQKKLGVHQFRVKKAMALTGRYSSAHLKKILSSAYDIDENIKSGLFDSTLALEFFIANI